MNKYAIKRVAASFLLSSILVPLSSYASETYKPAGFAFDGADLAALVDKPASLEAETTKLVFYCQADINPLGKAETVSCFNDKEEETIQAQTQNAIKELSFDAAQVDGKAVPVRMSFRVVLSSPDENLKATLIPNLGSMQQQYGRNYTAPQERLDVSDWYERYSKNSWVNGNAFLGEGKLTRVATTITTKGKPDTIRALKGDRAFKKDANIVKTVLKKSRFIPGFIDEKPVPMGYMVIVNYDNQNQEMIGSR